MSGTEKPPAGRGLHVRVKTAKGRKSASTRWLQRQLNDPYVHRAKAAGYRSRAAYKLIELDKRFCFLAPGKTVLDLGAAPGGWTQVAVTRCGKGRVLALDLLPIAPIPGAVLLERDFMADDVPDLLKTHLGGAVDIVLSDMAPNASGQSSVDHLRIMALVEAAYLFACEVLKPGGAFVAKVLQGGTEQALLKDMRRRFASVKHAKPGASRKDSAETYVVAEGFKGATYTNSKSTEYL